MTSRLSAMSALLATLVLAACEGGVYQGTLVMDGVQEFGADEAVHGDLIVIDGEAIVGPESHVTGAVYLLGGSLNLAGRVDGDVHLLLGELILRDAAHIAGNLNIAGGRVDRAPGATIGGDVGPGLGLELPGDVTTAVPSIREQLSRALLQSLLVGAVAVLNARFMPRALGRVVTAAREHPLVSGSMGALIGIISLSLLVLMAFTIVLIPVSILGLILLGLVVVFGWAAVGTLAGRSVARRLNLRLGPAVTAFGGAFLLMLALSLLNTVPLVGGLVALIVSCIGLGAVFITGLGTRTFVPAVDAELAAEEGRA